MVPDDKNFDKDSGKESQSEGKADRNIRKNFRFSRRKENQDGETPPEKRTSRHFQGRGTRRDRKSGTSESSGSKERGEKPKGEPVVDTASIKPRRMAEMEKGSKSILNITNLAVLGVLIGLVLFVIKIAAVFGIFLFSFVIAFLLFPMVEWLNSKHIPRVWAILIVYVVFGAILFGISAAIIPALITQASSLVRQIPEWIKDLQHTASPHIADWKTYLQDAGIKQTDIDNYIDRTIPTIQQWAISLGQKIAVGMQGALGGIVS
ncbi:MAG: AI-2E family transporter, partial [bacterium]